MQTFCPDVEPCSVEHQPATVANPQSLFVGGSGDRGCVATDGTGGCMMYVDIMTLFVCVFVKRNHSALCAAGFAFVCV